MGVRVVDYKRDGRAWVQVCDRRLPRKRAFLLVGNWDQAREVARVVEKRLADGDLSWAAKEAPAVVEAPPSTALTLRRAVEEYLAERVRFRTMEPHTRDNYIRELRLHCYPTLGDRDVRSISRRDLKTVFERVLDAGKSKAICRNILAPVRGVYDWLIDERGFDGDNPAARFGKLIGEKLDKKRRVKPLTDEQQVLFLSVARTDRFYFLFLMALGVGLRLSECFGLQWDDFDVAARVVTIQRQLLNGKRIERPKRGKDREVPLSEDVVREFLIHRKAMEQEATKRQRELPAWVFVTRFWGPIRSKSSFYRRHLRPLVVKAGINRKVTMQHMRQTFVSGLVNAGYLGPASDYAGHSSIKVTGDYYSRATLDPSIVDSLDEKRRDARMRLSVGRLRRVQ